MGLDYYSKTMLAPMVRIGTLPARILALKYGADIVYTEEIIDFKVLKTSRIENSMLGTVDFVMKDGTVVFQTCALEKDRVVFQVGTSDPRRALKVAKMVENDVAAFDVNMGCPKTFSVSGGMGAALLTQPDKIKSILTLLVTNLSIPVTCKIRCFPNVEDTIKLCKLIESTGVAAIGVHGRTKDERPRHPCRYSYIKQIAETISIPIIANGGSADIKEYNDIAEFKMKAGTSSVMLARAAEWNLSIFRAEGSLTKQELIREYCRVAIDYDNHWTNTKYNVQQTLGSEVQYEDGVKLLASKCAEDIYVIYGMLDYYKAVLTKHQKYLQKEKEKREAGLDHINNLAVKISRDENGKIVSYECDHHFDRKYAEGNDTPKMFLVQYQRTHEKAAPVFENSVRKVYNNFRSTLKLDGVSYINTSWHKRKIWADHAACEMYMVINDIRSTTAARRESHDLRLRSVGDGNGLAEAGIKRHVESDCVEPIPKQVCTTTEQAPVRKTELVGS